MSWQIVVPIEIAKDVLSTVEHSKIFLLSYDSGLQKVAYRKPVKCSSRDDVHIK